MKAKHEPSGEIFDADKIKDGSWRKNGPWVCEDCGLRYTYHRKGGQAKKSGSQERAYRRGTFSKPLNREHDPACYHHPEEARRRLKAEHPDHVRVKDGVLLLHFGEPLTEPKASGRTAQQDTDDFANLSATDYQGVLDTACAIAAVIDQHDGDEKVLAGYAVRHQGATIPWTDFAYGPGNESLTRLSEIIRSSTSRTRTPCFVRGIIESVTKTKREDKWHVRMIGTGANTAHISLWARVDRPVGVMVEHFAPGMDINVLFDQVGWLTEANWPWIEVHATGQLHAQQPS